MAHEQDNLLAGGVLIPGIGVVIPVGPGRDENLAEVLKCLRAQTEQPDMVVVVRDGDDAAQPPRDANVVTITAAKHEPGREQPRNIGVRALTNLTKADLVWFVDSDVVFEDDCLKELVIAYDAAPEKRVLVAPYDWLAPGNRPPIDPDNLAMPDPRWAMFHASPPDRVYREDLSAGLACFSGNLVWPISEFQRVGGFYSEFHHGRCEDGELGVRAVAMGVPISLAAKARGYHLSHEVNMRLALERNRRDVPLLNARHPWIEGADVFMVDRDGKAFDVRCHGCGEQIPTIGWWEHAANCAGMELTVDVP